MFVPESPSNWVSEVATLLLNETLRSAVPFVAVPRFINSVLFTQPMVEQFVKDRLLNVNWSVKAVWLEPIVAPMNSIEVIVPCAMPELALPIENEASELTDSNRPREPETLVNRNLPVPGEITSGVFAELSAVNSLIPEKVICWPLPVCVKVAVPAPT